MKITKTVFALFIAILLTNVSFAQKAKTWPELEAMKTIMKQTFPYLIKNNDLAPAKANASQMLEAANNLAISEKPRAFRNKKMNLVFEKIALQAHELDKLVKNNAIDEEIKIKLAELHGSFAEIAHHKKAPGTHQHGEK